MIIQWNNVVKIPNNTVMSHRFKQLISVSIK